MLGSQEVVGHLLLPLGLELRLWALPCPQGTDWGAWDLPASMAVWASSLLDLSASLSVPPLYRWIPYCLSVCHMLFLWRVQPIQTDALETCHQCPPEVWFTTGHAVLSCSLPSYS